MDVEYIEYVHVNIFITFQSKLLIKAALLSIQGGSILFQLVASNLTRLNEMSVAQIVLVWKEPVLLRSLKLYLIPVMWVPLCKEAPFDD